MEFKEVVLSRRSVRAYQSKPVRDEDLAEILQAGLYAPSAVNFQPWYFVVIRSEAQMQRLLALMGQVSQRIEPILQERFEKHPAVAEESVRFIRNMGGAPVCILAFQLKPSYAKTESTIVQSVSAAIENILLAAVDKGLGGCWLTAPLETAMGEELRQAFAPDHGKLVALLTLGYPERPAKAPARKEGRYVIV